MSSPRLAVRTVAAAVAVLSIIAGAASGRITPERLYNPVGRPIPVVVEVPEDATGEIEIRLLRPRSGEPVATAVATRGRADLASLFPVLHDARALPAGARVLYAQVFAGGRAVGPALVLQPMVPPERAGLIDPATLRPTSNPAVGELMFDDERRVREAARRGSPLPPTPRPLSGWRAYVDRHVVLETSEGIVEVRLRPDAAPNTAWWFLHLAENGFYDGAPFHRVVPRLADGTPFLVQFGDPTGTGLGGAGQWQDLERSSLEHGFGVLGAARFGEPDSWNGQVFIGLGRRGTASLDRGYAAFAEAVAGASTIQAIADRETDADDRPLEMPVIERVLVVDAPPRGSGPEPLAEPSPSRPEERPVR